MFLDGFHLPHISAPEHQTAAVINRYRRSSANNNNNNNNSNNNNNRAACHEGESSAIGGGRDDWLRSQLSQGLNRLQTAWKDYQEPLSWRLSKVLRHSSSRNTASSQARSTRAGHSGHAQPPGTTRRRLSAVDCHVRRLSHKLNAHRKSLRKAPTTTNGTGEGRAAQVAGKHAAGKHQQQVWGAAKGVEILRRSLSLNATRRPGKSEARNTSPASQQHHNNCRGFCGTKRELSMRLDRGCNGGSTPSSWLGVASCRSALLVGIALVILVGGVGLTGASPLPQVWLSAPSLQVSAPGGPATTNRLMDVDQLARQLGLDTTEELEEPRPVTPSDQWLWIQRRRLNRDRALEPPGWMREQPMRRGFGRLGPTGWSADEEGRSDESMAAVVPATPTVGGRFERNTPTSALSVYDEALRQILESSPGGRALLDELYEELQQRLASNGASKLAEGSATGEASVPQRADQTGQPSDDQQRDQILVEPESALVVVADEPDGGENSLQAPPARVSNKMSAAQVASGNSMGDATMFEADLGANTQPQGVGLSADGPQQARLYERTKSRLSAIPSVARLYDEASIELAQADALPADSFHVLEDIDREVDSPAGSIPESPAFRRPNQEAGGAAAATAGSGQSESMWAALAGPEATGAPSVLPAQKRTPIQQRPYAPSLSPATMAAASQANYRTQQQLLPLVAGAESSATNRESLIRLASLVKVKLERLIGLPSGSILGVYPLNSEQLLLRLDVELLEPYNMMRMIQDYDYARGYIVATWPAGTRDNPIPLFNAIMESLAHSGQQRAGSLSERFAKPLPAERLTTQEVLAQLQRHQLAAAYLQSVASGSAGDDDDSAGRLAAVQRLLMLLDARRMGVAPEVGPDEPTKSTLGSLLIWRPGGSRRDSLGLVCIGLVLLAALAVSYLAVKLAMGRGSAVSPADDQRGLLRRSLGGSWRSIWTSGSESCGMVTKVGGVVEGEPSEGEKLADRPPVVAHDRAGQLEHISRRLSRLLSGLTSGANSPQCASSQWAARRRASAHKASAGELEQLVGPGGESEEIDEVTNGDEALDEGSGPRRRPDAATPTSCRLDKGAGGSVRSSKSYIKSLVEALSKARSSTSIQWSSSNKLELDKQPDERQVGEKQQSPPPHNNGGSDSDQDIVVSQMDISAAHLILAYMEKHLEDKEQLRREWAELNAPMCGSAGSAGSASPKPLQLMLSRQARVALQESNRWKNRSQLVVPFDRNRVKLGAPRSGSSGSADYINASFIHDDEPRRPTHIIAQGPTERTLGHFWQMVWEQGVCVIVMLTRLNENNAKMCHCYWPAAPVASAEQVQTAASPGGLGRRASVTSVFSTLGHNNGQPIVGNGELDNNVLHLDTTSANTNTINNAKPASSPAAPRLEVHLVSEHVSSPDYLVRNLYLINKTSGESRAIVQFHYLAWPRGGVPESARSLLQFRRKVHKSYRNLRSPLLIHSSDGSGRAGTYTLIDTILERIKNGAKEIDPRATLEHLRDQRAGLCATQSQFEFVLVALAEEIQMILNALPQ